MRNRLVITAILMVFTAFAGLGKAIAKTAGLVACEKSPLTGSWKTIDKSSDFLIGIDIVDKCKEIKRNPYAVTSPWASSLGHDKDRVYRTYTVRAYSRCSPANCVWGRAKANRDGRGGIKANFKMFWSKRYLQLKREKNTLLAKWKVEYIGRKKPDQFGEAVLVKDD